MQNSAVLNSGLNTRIFTASCSWSGVTHDFNNLSLCTYSVFSIKQLRYFPPGMYLFISVLYDSQNKS
jgi:hypothetical protein